MLSESIAGEEFTAANHELVLLNIRDLTLVITFKQTHSSAPERRSSLQVALPNERRRPNAR